MVQWIGERSSKEINDHLFILWVWSEWLQDSHSVLSQTGQAPIEWKPGQLGWELNGILFMGIVILLLGIVILLLEDWACCGVGNICMMRHVFVTC